MWVRKKYRNMRANDDDDNETKKNHSLIHNSTIPSSPALSLCLSCRINMDCMICVFFPLKNLDRQKITYLFFYHFFDKCSASKWKQTQQIWKMKLPKMNVCVCVFICWLFLFFYPLIFRQWKCVCWSRKGKTGAKKNATHFCRWFPEYIKLLVAKF